MPLSVLSLEEPRGRAADEGRLRDNIATREVLVTLVFPGVDRCTCRKATGATGESRVVVLGKGTGLDRSCHQVQEAARCNQDLM